jgi:hypothetical protein
MKTNRIPRIAPGFLIATARIFRGLESSKMVVRERPKKPLSGLWRPAPFFRFYLLRKIYFDHRLRGIVCVVAENLGCALLTAREATPKLVFLPHGRIFF